MAGRIFCNFMIKENAALYLPLANNLSAFI